MRKKKYKHTSSIIIELSESLSSTTLRLIVIYRCVLVVCAAFSGNQPPITTILYFMTLDWVFKPMDSSWLYLLASCILIYFLCACFIFYFIVKPLALARLVVSRWLSVLYLCIISLSLILLLILFLSGLFACHTS